MQQETFRNPTGLRVAAATTFLVITLFGWAPAGAQDNSDDQTFSAIKRLVEVVSENNAVPVNAIPAVLRFGPRRNIEALTPGKLSEVNGTVSLSKSVLASRRDTDLFIYGISVPVDLPPGLPEGVTFRELAESLGISKERILLGRLNVRFDEGLQMHVATVQIDPEVLAKGMGNTTNLFATDLGDSIVPDDTDSTVFYKLADTHVGRAQLHSGQTDDAFAEVLSDHPVVQTASDCIDWCFRVGPVVQACDCVAKPEDPWVCPGGAACLGVCW